MKILNNWVTLVQRGSGWADLQTQNVLVRDSTFSQALCHLYFILSIQCNMSVTLQDTVVELKL